MRVRCLTVLPGSLTLCRSEEGGALQFNDTWVLTLTKDGGTASWRRLETHGEPPSPRTGYVWREACVWAPFSL